jgi:hypothetical protein
MLNRKIFTFKDIDELITDIPQVEYKCFIYCIFSGLSIQDIRYLRMQDYDNNTNELKLNTGRIFKPDKLLYNLMAQTDSLEYFDKYGDGSTLEGRYKFKYKYSPSEYVFKNSGANNKSIDGAISIGVYNRFLREVQRYFNNKNITYSNLHKSGLINFIKEKYEAKDVTMKEVFTKMKNNREYEYDSETQEYIYEFGEKITTRMLRMDIIDIVDQL